MHESERISVCTLSRDPGGRSRPPPTLSTWVYGGPFAYKGSVDQGTEISYGDGLRYHTKVSAAQYQQLLDDFRGQTVDPGTSRTAPPPRERG